MTKTKVVIVINDFLVGGAQRLVVNLLRHIDRSRFEVMLVTLFEFPGRDTMYELLPEDIRVHRLSFRGFSDVASWFRYMSILRTERPQVVLSHLFFANTVTRIIGVLLSYRTIIVEHNTYIHKTSLQIFCDRILAGMTKKIVAVSEAVRDFTIRQERISEKRFIVIPNGIEVEKIAAAAQSANIDAAYEELGIARDRRLIVTVGRMTAQKNLPLMIDGFSRFARKHPLYDLLILGDGGLRADIEAKAAASELKERIHILGNRPDLSAYYAAADYFLSTSDIEGLSMAHLEAQASGVPLVCTRTAGSEELIDDGKNGYFIEERSADGVAQALIRMHDSNLPSMRERSHKKATAYDIKKTTVAYEVLIEG